jgi:hypothetical protein
VKYLFGFFKKLNLFLYSYIPKNICQLNCGNASHKHWRSLLALIILASSLKFNLEAWQNLGDRLALVCKCRSTRRLAGLGVFE